MDEQKQNLCNAAGECTATSLAAEKTCRHHTAAAAIYSRAGMCILRAWTGRCMNPTASEEAKQQARMARTAIDAAATANGE